ncbi:MAG: prepilin-type N-terminal cleavage/methylation domain-containing protein [Patescibacteria group bacterium]
MIKKSKIKNQKSKFLKGFTLVELVMAMSIFVILISIAAGGFVNILRNQRLVIALMVVNDNMSLSMEQMAREIRTGYNFSKISNQEFQFVNSHNQIVSYRLNEGAIERVTESVILEKIPKKITADNVKIVNFNVEICGNNISPDILLDSCGGGGGSNPPRITLSFSITSSEPDIEKLKIFTNIQTTVSSRVLI